MPKYDIGCEPDNIKKRLITLFDKLDSAYPDKVIIGLHTETDFGKYPDKKKIRILSEETVNS